MADTVTPPGKGIIVTCPDCTGIAGGRCHGCQGQGRYVMRACPLSGDPGWDYINGTDDGDGMACRISRGYTWTANNPSWCAQVLRSAPT